ncbi:hypothetical protein UFOVP223_78 [uncultured Caudovirales phage]|uniref:Uncharacterized protein n=1 Tax=uncultured Caudovirales phage TaxID=2100421 RepID=A0A6J5L4Q1_9CAUD|nr:hypothetical protein UFOVP110_86 [uncultured Caudovirales phage]CAB5219461.1 hypothetical protein UFOVP223_78 [uncultured Caudovirales phage]
MGIAPAPQFPEKAPQVYERKMAENVERRGPLRFEEGVATDTDVPTDFQKGIMNGFAAAPGRPNRNAPVWDKPAAETLSERAHVGSAAWIEAPTFLGEFAHGSFNNNAEQIVESKIVSGGRTQRVNPTVVQD